MLVGPTYITRLWCVMEVFIFMRIKDVGAGSARLASQFITVKLLGDSTDLVLSLARFDAAKAQCRIKMIAPRRYGKELAGEDLEDAPLDIRQLLHLLEVARSVLEEDDHEDEQQN